MAYTIPTTEPVSARAGDSWKWTRSLPDYPASTWTLTYTLWTASAALTITASASGADHAVDVDSATTGAYVAGRYEWVARVTDGTDTYSIGSGTLQILPAVGAAMDTRSHARKMLDALNALIEGRATDGDIDVVRTSVATSSGDRSTQWDMPTLLKLRQQYAAAVAAEEDAARIARGERSSRLIGVRFAR
jgi:hypothetical protein